MRIAIIGCDQRKFSILPLHGKTKQPSPKFLCDVRIEFMAA
jgi:hypothetical protein